MIPRKLTEKIANRAVEECKIYGRHHGWESTEDIKAFARKDVVGIRLNGAYWLRFQNDGTRRFVMWNLEGKTIPLRENVFRVASGVGQPGYVHIDDVLVWRDRKWEHPGITATHFVDRAVKRAFDMYGNEVRKYGPIAPFKRVRKTTP